MKKIDGLKPFGRFIMTIGQLPASYLVSMTYEEQLIWLCNYLENTVIPTVNNNGEAVEELQNLYIELKSYVDNYFENLDVQEEINNKLDEMAESGQLESIIAAYLSLAALFVYDTALDLAAATNLSDGSSAYILGKTTYNDGKGAFYKIREITISDVVDGDNIIGITATDDLVAEKLPNYYVNKNTEDIATNAENINTNATNISLLNCLDPYYSEITYSYNRANNTNYYLVDIPFEDSEGDEIPFELIAAGENISPLDKSHIEDSNFTCNGSLAVNNGETYVNGNVIINGEIVNNNDVSAYCTDEKYMGIKADRTIAIYNNDTTAQAMVEDGVLFGCLIFGQCVVNGVIDPDFAFQTVKGPDIFIGQKANKDLVIIACDGRNNANEGMNYQQMCQILIGKGCINAYALDGGGSTSVNFKGNKLNMNVDDGGTKDRKITYLFNVNKKPTINKLTDLYNYVGEMRQLLNYQLRPLINNAEIKHYYFRGKLTSSFTPSAGNTVIPFGASAPYDPVFSITTDANGGTHVNLPNGEGYVRVGGTIVSQASSAQAGYLYFYWNSSEVTNIGENFSGANDVRALTGTDLFFINGQTNEITFRTANTTALRGYFWIEWWPINNTTYVA